MYAQVIMINLISGKSNCRAQTKSARCEHFLHSRKLIAGNVFRQFRIVWLVYLISRCSNNADRDREQFISLTLRLHSHIRLRHIVVRIWHSRMFARFVRKIGTNYESVFCGGEASHMRGFITSQCEIQILNINTATQRIKAG